MQSNNSNFLMAILLSLGVLVGYHYLVEKPRLEAAQQAQLAAKPAPGAPVAAATPAEAPAETKARAEIVAAGLASGERIRIDSPRVAGTLNLRGGRLDDLALVNYHETPEQSSPAVTLLSPAGSAAPAQPYFAETGWLAEGTTAALPGADTLWKTGDPQLTKDHPVTLSWDNGQGLVFTRLIALDDNFMFTVTDSVASTGKDAVTLYPFSLVARQAAEPAKSMFILHEGPLGVFDGTLHEVKSTDLNDKPSLAVANSGKGAGAGKLGWLGITDKYWLVALAPGATDAPDFTGRFSESGAAHDHTQADARGAALTLAPGGTVTATTHVFAGAKEVRLLEAYEEQLKIANFDHAVDFGWFYFLTKPYFHALDGIANLCKGTGYGFACAILIFTVILKLAFFPLQSKSYRSMNRMRDMQPRFKELKERWAHDRQRLNQETFELYRKEKINPASGCWPTLIQIPVFFALYKVLYVTIEMRHAPFPGWIPDLSAPDPTNLFTLFGLIPWVPPHQLHLGIWPILMGVTMFLQQRLSPPPGDPVQQAVFRWLPLFFMFLLANFPAGLVIYWTWSNLLGIIQQRRLRGPVVKAPQ